LAWLADL